MSKSLVEMTHELLLAQTSAKPMTTDEIKAAGNHIFQTLKSLQAAECSGAEQPGEAAGGAAVVDPKKSIQRSRIVCMECGQEFKMLSSNHLATHGLNSKSYRQKYGLATRQPLCCKTISDQRSQSAKDRGLPENLRKYLESRATKKTALR